MYLPPYRHELRKIVEPFANVLTTRKDRPQYKQFRAILSELESIVTSEDIVYPEESARDAYISITEACQQTPHDVSDVELAKAITAATIATKTDILGSLYQRIGQTTEDRFNQYVTPPNVADAAAETGTIARQHFDPPTPTPENVTGETTLSVFSNPNPPESSTETETSGGRDASDDPLVVFDPACGSGRLPLAVTRREDTPSVVLGWELQQDSARMAALTLTLLDIPGWIVQGDAITLNSQAIYRITPSTDPSLKHFQTGSSKRIPDITNSRPADPRDYQPYAALQASTATKADVIQEISRTLEAGVDRTVGNPPFTQYDLDNIESAANRTSSDYALAQSPIGTDGNCRSSQAVEWLFTELAIEFTKPDGAITYIVPTAMLARESDKAEREWLLNTVYYESGLQLPPATFAPETTTGTTIISLIPKEPSYIGVRPEHEITMMMAEAIGHDKRATKRPLEKGGEPVTVATSDLPAYYTVHRWRGSDQVQVPDDDLLGATNKHYEHRTSDTNDSTGTTSQGTTTVSTGD